MTKADYKNMGTFDVQYLFGLFQRYAGLGVGRGMRRTGPSPAGPAGGFLAGRVLLFEGFGQRFADDLRPDNDYLHNILGHGANCDSGGGRGCEQRKSAVLVRGVIVAENGMITPIRMDDNRRFT